MVGSFKGTALSGLVDLTAGDARGSRSWYRCRMTAGLRNAKTPRARWLAAFY